MCVYVTASPTDLIVFLEQIEISTKHWVLTLDQTVTSALAEKDASKSFAVPSLP